MIYFVPVYVVYVPKIYDVPRARQSVIGQFINTNIHRYESVKYIYFFLPLPYDLKKKMKRTPRAQRTRKINSICISLLYRNMEETKKKSDARSRIAFSPILTFLLFARHIGGFVFFFLRCAFIEARILNNNKKKIFLR